MSGQRGVRIDGAPVRAAGPDLEVQLRRSVGGVARVAEMTDQLARPHRPRAADVVAAGARSNRCCRRSPRRTRRCRRAGRPGRTPSRPSTATSGVPLGAKRSLPWWRATTAARRAERVGERHRTLHRAHPRSGDDDLTRRAAARRRAAFSTDDVRPRAAAEDRRRAPRSRCCAASCDAQVVLGPARGGERVLGRRAPRDCIAPSAVSACAISSLQRRLVIVQLARDRCRVARSTSSPRAFTSLSIVGAPRRVEDVGAVAEDVVEHERAALVGDDRAEAAQRRRDVAVAR